jgi:hypothetical protein
VVCIPHTVVNAKWNTGWKNAPKDVPRNAQKLTLNFESHISSGYNIKWYKEREVIVNDGSDYNLNFTNHSL